eukprot:68011_1
MKYISIFANKIKSNKAGSIRDIIRCKNGWSIYDKKYPCYTDIKLNVLVESSLNNVTSKVISEVQLLLHVMSSFKKKAHKLYSIERNFELVYNFSNLKNKMIGFKDNIGINGVICELVKNDDIKYFKLLWNLIIPNQNSLIDFTEGLDKNVWNTALINVIDQRGKIHDYLQQQFRHLYFETILCYMHKYSQTNAKNNGGYKSMLQSISSPTVFQDGWKSKGNQQNLVNILLVLFNLVQDNNKTKYNKLIKCLSQRYDAGDKKSGWDKIVPKTFTETMCNEDIEYCQSIRLILHSQLINDNDKCRLLCVENNKAFIYAVRQKRLHNAFEILNYIKYDKNLLMNLLNIKDESYDGATALQWICSNRYNTSTKLLALILFNLPFLNHNDKT